MEYTTFTTSSIKVIFLDIDGVLNGYNFRNTLGWKIIRKFNSNKLKGWYRNLTQPFGVHKSKVKRLAKIVHKTDAKVVISSSWRSSFLSNRLGKEEQKLIELFDKYNIEIYGYTPVFDSGSRGDEIITWLLNNICDRYIILDDEIHNFDKFETLSDKYIQTCELKETKFIKGYWYEDTGLKRKHVRQAIKMLNRGVII